MRKRKLNIKTLVAEAAKFAEIESTYDEPSLYGVTDGKAVGTYLEHKFTQYLAKEISMTLLLLCKTRICLSMTSRRER